MVFVRLSTPPSELIESLGLPPGARTLASTPVGFTEHGPQHGWLVVTNRGLGISQDSSSATLPHTDWPDIERIKLKRVEDSPKRGSAAWLSVHLVDQSPAHRVLLPNAAQRVASVINERLTASIVVIEHLPVGSTTVRGAVRRDHANRLQVQVVVPDDPAGHSPEVHAAARLLAERLSEATGLRAAPGLWGEPQ